jgi:voltage-gated potassium channel
MERLIEKLSGHTIICGSGKTGTRVIEEHAALHRSFVVIDRNELILQHHAQRFPGMAYIVGDATSEETLVAAGIERARSLVATLGTDKDNLFLLVTARYLRKDLRIASEAHDPEASAKFRAAGADYVVSPTFIGGMRIASHILRPAVVDFLDAMLRGDQTARVLEVMIGHGSELAGRTILDSHVHQKTGLLIVALRPPNSQDFVYSPQGDALLLPGTVVVLIGPVAQIPRLEELARARA